MNKDDFKGRYKGPEPQELVKTITELIPTIVSAVQHSAIPAKEGLLFVDFSERILRMHGDRKSKLELTRGAIVMEARNYSEGNKLAYLKKQCAQAERFEAYVKTTKYYNPTFTESRCRVYEITAGCIIRNAVDGQDYREACEYLNKAVAILHALEKANPGYTANPELKASITTKLRNAQKHLR